MHSNLMHLKFFNAKYNLVGMKNILFFLLENYYFLFSLTVRSLAKTSNYDCIVRYCLKYTIITSKCLFLKDLGLSAAQTKR